MKKVFLLLIVLFSLVSACSPDPTPEPTPEPSPTVIPSPTLSDLFKSQSLKFVEEASKLKTMTEQGVNFVDYSAQLSEVGGVYEILKSLWVAGFEVETQQSIEKALEGWECAKVLWDLKINYKYAVNNEDSTREYFHRIYNYGGDNLDINVHKDTFFDDISGEVINNISMPYDENISILFTLANDYFGEAQPALLSIIQ